MIRTPIVIDETLTRGTPPLPGFHILVPVWGAAYCDLFTQISLPSQLASGNLPSLPHKGRCLYHVLTTPEDATRIETSAAWRQLQSLMPVQIDLRSDQERTPHETFSAYLRQGIELADKDNAASLFFNPDLVFADGTINSLVQCVKAGARVVFTTGIRLSKETVMAVIDRHRAEQVIALAPRDLAAIAMQNLHPISRQNIWTDQKGTLLPATLFWPVENEGLLARCFHLHPLLVWPERKHVFFDGTVDDDFVPMACPRAETDHVVTDSDELLICEISDFSRVAKTGYRKGSVDDVVDWAESHTDQRHRRLATLPIRFHATAMTESLWAPVEAESAKVMDEVLRRLDQSWVYLLFRSPMWLLRRWVRYAATAAISERNLRREVAWRGWIAGAYLNFYRRYSAFCERYENFRTRLSDILFGSLDRPYPWNGHWFTSGKQTRAALRLVTSPHGRTLVVAPSPEVRRQLAQVFDGSIVMEWPQHGVAAAEGLEQWPYATGAFDLVVCVGALQYAQNPDAFMAELSRIMAPRAHAVIVTPHLATHSDTASQDYRRYSLSALEALVPATFQVERSLGAGGLGSTMAGLLYGWSEYQRRVRRISPVILEIPILPILLLVRLLAGCIAALAAGMFDLLDHTGRFYTYSAASLLRRGGDQTLS